MGDTRPDGLNLPIVAVSLVGVALVLARAATFGIEWSGDGVYYVSVARSVLAGEGFFSYFGNAMTDWPAGYPLALILVSGFGIFDPAAVVWPLNVAMHGLTIIVVGNYLRQHIESRSLVVWACFAIALSNPLVQVASMAFAESLFILLTTLALIQTHRLLMHGNRSALFLAAIFSAMAWQTRYLGVGLPVAVGLVLLFQRGASWATKAERLAIYSAIVALPMGLWLLRNHMVAGGPLRVWGTSDLSLFPSEAIGAVLAWARLDFDLLFGPGSGLLALALNVLVPLAVAATGLLVIATRPRAHTPFDWRPFYIFGAFVIAYFASLSIASTAGYWRGFYERFVFPLWVPLVITGAFAFDWLFSWASANKHGRPADEGAAHPRVLPRVFVGTLGIALTLWTVDQALHTVRETRRENSFAEHTRGYSGAYWLRSETSRYIRRNPLDGVVLSNISEMAYHHNAGKSTHYGTIHWAHPYHLSIAPTEAAIDHAADGAYVVWFRDWEHARYSPGEAQLRIIPGLTEVANLADGTIFQVRHGYMPPNPYRQAQRLIAAGMLGSPAVRSTFDIYRVGRTLIYFKRPCLSEDTEANFFVHFTVARSGPAKEAYVGGKGFNFWEAGTMLDGDLCVAISELPPGEPIVHIRTGQFGSIDWSAEPDVAGLSGLGA